MPGARALDPPGERHTLKNGSSVWLRPIRPGDAKLEEDFVAGLSPRSRHFRFMTSMRSLPRDMLARFVNVDYTHDMAILALAHDAGREVEVGVARYFAAPGGESCEFAVTVTDAWQDVGLGHLLIQKLLDAARAQGLKTMTGEVLAENVRMLKLCRRLGFSLSRESGAGDVCDVSVRL